jgi:hypothetical protein
MRDSRPLGTAPTRCDNERRRQRHAHGNTLLHMSVKRGGHTRTRPVTAWTRPPDCCSSSEDTSSSGASSLSGSLDELCRRRQQQRLSRIAAPQQPSTRTRAAAGDGGERAYHEWDFYFE